MTKETVQKWWRCQFKSIDAEENAHLLFELGVQGVEIISDTELLGYYSGESVSDITPAAEAAGFQLVTAQPVEQKNWVQECEQLWAPLRIGEIDIIPVMGLSVEQPAEPAEKTIYIIPGQGFGTGHHPSTAAAIGLLQHPDVRASKPARILDMGTGSGLLALAAAALFEASIDAIDFDPEALVNARDNLQINPRFRNIALQQGSFERVTGSYDLIVANIYAEVLIRFENNFHSHLRPGGHLILAGIMSHLRADIESCFVSPRWTSLQIEDNGQWTAMIYRKDK